ncbi:MAG TPA: IS110 family transposase [Candidatus Binatia bacterium]|nr:IS110 family transposase [Candidatus Binatia bacterium]
MLIIGCDFHPGFQQLAIFDKSTAEVRYQRLQHPAEAQAFYAGLNEPALIGMEACGFTQWFERLLGELGHQLWMGDAAQIRASVVRRQKTDQRDAEHILNLVLEGRFPRVWVPNPENRDVRQLLLHRHHLVRSRTQVKNQLQAMALNQGVQKKRKLWSEAGREQLQKMVLPPYTAQRRDECLERLDYLDEQIRQLSQIVAGEAEQRTEVRLLMTHPGVGPQTALAFVLTIGEVERFPNAKKIASYVGLIPSEHSSGGKQRLGHITKQGSPLLRFLLVEAAQTAARFDPTLKRVYVRLSLRRSRGQAKVAVARRLATRLYWMLREGKNYAQLTASGAGAPVSSCDAA